MKRKRTKKYLSWGIFMGSFLFLFLALSGVGLSQKDKTPVLVRQGKKIYSQVCTPCHGPQGNGKGILAATLNPPPADFTKPYSQWNHSSGDPKKVFEVVTKGIPGTAMVNFQFSEDERWALVYTVMDFSKDKGR